MLLSEPRAICRQDDGAILPTGDSYVLRSFGQCRADQSADGPALKRLYSYSSLVVEPSIVHRKMPSGIGVFPNVLGVDLC